MGTKTISITDEVYNQLKKLKGENESFSQLIKRLIEVKFNFKNYFGSWKITDEEYNLIWNNLVNRKGRRWNKFDKGI